MKKFFEEIVSLEDSGFRRQRTSFSKDSFGEVAFDTKNPITYYYKSIEHCPPSQFIRHEFKTKNKIEAMDDMQRFKVTSVVLSAEDLKMLAHLVCEHENEIQEKGWKSIITFAKVLKSAGESGSLLQANYLREKGIDQNEDCYLFFFKKENLGIDIENNYTANLHTSRSVKGNHLQDQSAMVLLGKIQEATRNLFYSLDLSIFFDPSRDWNLVNIVEFVLQFSYLFENKRSSQNTVPLKLIAQFLHTYLKYIPAEYKAENFRKLYTNLLKESEKKFETRRKIANRNKKLLLLAINFTEKHQKDISQEVSIQESLKRKKFFINFIRRGRIPACLLTIRESNQVRVQVSRIETCPHSKLAPVQDFVLGNRKSMRSSVAFEDSHVNSIESFYQRFMKLDPVVQSTEEQNDDSKVGEAFITYMELIKEVLEQQHGEEEIDYALDEIEKYILAAMHNHIFPNKATIEDTNLYRKTLELDWVRPEHLDIAQEHRNEDMWKIAMEALESVNSFRAPSEKLECLIDCMKIIENVLSLVSSKSGLGADETLPIIIYVTIKSQPSRLYSNLNFISKFTHPNKMIGLKGFAFGQFQCAASFIESIDDSALDITAEEYAKSIAESRARHKIN